jgi:pantoate--beta-alanine ligase
MKIVRSVEDLRLLISQARGKRKLIGLVPTMGALHEGHISLIHEARKRVGKRGCIVVSIFVNPTQFNQKSDLTRYPRQLRVDAKMCKQAGTDMIFAPPAKEMYPPDFSTWVEEQSLSGPLCGATRPGHFRGVCTVVAKLFNQVQPDLAVFGQKDAQQAAVLCRMVRDLNFPIKMIISATVREKDGLALSSRNQHLSAAERNIALNLSRCLKLIRDSFRKTKETSKLLKIGKKFISQFRGIRLDYLELVDPETLKPTKKSSRGDLVAIAAFVGKTRLIDNIRL